MLAPIVLGALGACEISRPEVVTLGTSAKCTATRLRSRLTATVSKHSRVICAMLRAPVIGYERACTSNNEKNPYLHIREAFD